MLPVVLSLNFHDAFTVATTSGSTPDAEFVWQVEQTPWHFEVIDPSVRDVRVSEAMRQLPILCEPANKRLLAAGFYFHSAVLLLDVGPGPSDFAGEVIVNLAKVLEVLFGGEGRDKIREGLRNAGTDEVLIEGVFIPALLLRSHLDAAHAGLSEPVPGERRKLQSFLEGIVGPFRDLINRLVLMSEQGRLALPSYEAERVADDELAQFIESLQIRDPNLR